MEEIAIAVRFFIGIVLLISAAAKFGGRADFRATLHRYQIVPRRWLGPISSAVPIVEVLAALALFAGYGLRLAAALTGGLFVSFGIAMARSLLRGDQFACGCGFGTSSNISWAKVWFDLGLAGISVFAAVAPTRLAANGSPASFGSDLRAYAAIPMAVSLLAIFLGLMPTLLSTGLVAAKRDSESRCPSPG